MGALRDIGTVESGMRCISISDSSDSEEVSGGEDAGFIEVCTIYTSMNPTSLIFESWAVQVKLKLQQTLSHDSSSIKIEVYSNRKTRGY